jgi:hypothetical protein
LVLSEVIKAGAEQTNEKHILMKHDEKPLLAALMADVREFCAARRGRASALAAHLGIHQQQASAWLHGKAEPGGEATLQIRAWLEAERAAEIAARERVVVNAPARLAAALRGAVGA